MIEGADANSGKKLNNKIMTKTVKAHYVVCTTLAIIDLALQSSWSGYNVIAEYDGVVYELYKDNEGSTHEALMRVVAPDICPTDTVNVQLRKYDRAAAPLTSEWPKWDSFPERDIDPSLMAYELKRAYGLV